MHWLIVDIPNGEKIRDGIEKMKFAPSKMEITIFYRVNWKMQWLFLSEGTNQLFSLILKLKQVKTSEKSSEKS